MKTPKAHQMIMARRLAALIASAVKASGAHTVLVTSPRGQVGKTRLMSMVSPELNHVVPHGFAVYGRAVLTTIHPLSLPDDVVTIVDGPAMLEEASLEISDDWLQTFDGAIIVVNGRVTTRQNLSTTVSWLRASNIEPLGIIFNEEACPSLRQQLASWKLWVLKMMDWRALARSGRYTS